MRVNQGLEKYGHILSVYSRMHKIPKIIIAAVVYQESHFDAWAIKFEPHYSWLFGDDEREQTPAMLSTLRSSDKPTEWKSQQFSFGLMQVMGAVAREYKFRGKYLTELCDPSTGMNYGCKHLRKLIHKYKGNIDDGLAAYNAGSVRRLSNGEYRNQHYVNGVKKKVRLLERHTMFKKTNI